MPRRMKDDERIEMIIRGLLKQPENKRCINCNSLGPQYVCTTFWTFVCTSCSGVHREFTHRVKSVSMAKFNDEEIMALQAGGNERAREIYFKEWDPQRNTYPDSSNLHRLREFVKHVYVDRRYAGGNGSHRLPMVKVNSRNNHLERPSASNSGRDDFYDRGSLDKSSPAKKSFERNLKDIFEERSPRHSQEHIRSAGSQRGRSATRLEIVDDRFRDDGSVKTYDRSVKVESRARSGSPGYLRNNRCSSLPIVRPVKDVFGEKIPALKIGGPPKPSDGKDAVESARAQLHRTTNATIPVPPGSEQKQSQAVNMSSLIDFDDNAPEPTNDTTEPEASKDNNESSSATTSTNQTAANAPNTNSIESLLFDWPAPMNSPSAGAPDQMSATTTDDVGTAKAPEVLNNVGDLSITTVVKNDQPLDGNNGDTNDLSFSPCGNSGSNAPQSATSLEALYNQQWNNSPPPNDQKRAQRIPPEQSSKATDQQDGSINSSRKELPQDLFSADFASFSLAAPGWQMPGPLSTGYGMPFQPPAMNVAAFQDASKPRNPFDIGDEKPQAQAPMFPSMSLLQGALPNMPPSTGQPSPYASALRSQASPFGMNMAPVPGAYMGQQPNNMPLTRPQGTPDVGKSDDAFASLNPIKQPSGTDSSPTAPTSSSWGNPFG